MNFLGIDFGLSFIGLAFSQGDLVEPLGQLAVKGNSTNSIKKIKSICQKNKIEQIIIGLSSGKLKNTIIGFANKLKKATNLPVFFQNEDFTSKQARQKMIEAGKPIRKRKKDEHTVAACLILQEYLDTMKQITPKKVLRQVKEVKC